MTHHNFGLEAFVWNNLQYPEGYDRGEFISQYEKNGRRKRDGAFYTIYADLLQKLVDPQHNKEANCYEFSATIIGAITAGYLPQIVKVNANRSRDADYGLINYN